MTRYILLAIAAFMLAACGGAGGDSLEAKQAELKKKQDELATLEMEIKELQTEIAELGGDTLKPKGKLVTLIPVQDTTFKHYIDIQGMATTDDNIQVTTDMGGLVKQVMVNEGQNVSAGQTLIQLDNSVVLSQIAELETALDLATTTYQKQESLWNQGIGSEMQYLQAKNQKESLEKQLATTNTQLGKMAITSPINGVIDEVHLSKGEMASPGQPAVQVVSLGNIEIVADVPENYLPAVRTGEEVLIHFPAIKADKKATIKTVGNTIDLNNRTFKIRVQLANNDGTIKPNMLATVKVNDYSSEEALLVPSKLVKQFKGDDYVYILGKNESGQDIAVKQMITTGKSYHGQTEVVEGLKASDQLIESFGDVTDGTLVNIGEK